MLNGKCKENFEVYLLKWLKENIAWETETPDQSDIDHFYEFPIAMQIGVYVSFFDTVGLNPYTERYDDGEYDYVIINFKATEETKYNDGPFETLEECWEASILKSQDLYLKQN